MDWTMISNAEGPLERMMTLVYLLQCRYRVDASEAGRKLWAQCRKNQLCIHTIDEVRSELASPTEDVGLGNIITDTDARKYLKCVLDTFDECAKTCPKA
jgi:hypothetical protein